MKETLLDNHNEKILPQDIFYYFVYHLLPLAKTDYVKLRKIPGEVFYLHLKRSLSASKSGACICRLSFLGTLPGAEGLSWGTMLCTQAELSLCTAVCITYNQKSLLEKGVFKKSGSKSNINSRIQYFNCYYIFPAGSRVSDSSKYLAATY